MRRIVRPTLMSIATIFASTAAAAGPVSQPPLMPLPQSVTMGDGLLELEGPLLPRWSNCGNDRMLSAAAARMQDDIVRQTGLAFDAAKPVPLSVICEAPAFAADKGEGYRLSIASSGIAISAQGPAGVLRAFATLRQVIGLEPQAIRLPVMTINDAPRFAWRGVMLDTARHFLTISTIKRQIDAMERVKFNVLHLHLSDDQAFRVESHRYPKLTANNAGEFYTQAEVRDLVAYAADRGVRVVPEFDMPAHTRAITLAYPEIGVMGKKGVLGTADATLNPASPATYRFVDRLVGEMAALFPDPVFHGGGDEVPKGVWDGNEAIKALMRKDNLADTRAVETYFERRIQAILRRHGKTMIGWEEIAARDGVASDAIVQAWQTSNATADATARKYRTVVSAGYYLDLLMPADFHYAIDPLDTRSAGFTPEFASGLRRVNPLLADFVSDAMIAFPRDSLTPEQEKLVLGGEAPLWGEIVSDQLVDARLWPRAAALAERFWSAESVRDPADMYHRLAAIGDILTTDGLDDLANRTRMVLRLSPANAEPVETLLAIVGPVRNMAHDHRIKAALMGKKIVQPLNHLSDAAPVDSMAARRFADQAARYTKGDHSLATGLIGQLTLWQGNDARFIIASTGKQILEEARPASAQIALLAGYGLQAVDAIEARHPIAPEIVAKAHAALDLLDQQDKASWRPIEALLKPQPPADLIVKIGPGIRTLIDAAAAR